MLAEPGWADSLIDALAMPGMAWLLLFVGIAALYAELHTPGIGVGAFIAGICFLLFFWSKYLGGTADWLEALLFLSGLLCILLEVFVLPGTAIFGLGGGLLIIVSLILASQTFVLPHNDYQFRQLRDTLIGLSAVGWALFLRLRPCGIFSLDRLCLVTWCWNPRLTSRWRTSDIANRSSISRTSLDLRG